MVFIQEQYTFFGDVKLSILYEGEELNYTHVDAEQPEDERTQAKANLLANEAVRTMKYILKNSNKWSEDVLRLKNRLANSTNKNLVFALFSSGDLDALKASFPAAGPHRSGCLHALQKFERIVEYYEKNCRP